MSKDDRVDALAYPRQAPWSWRCFFGIHRWTKWCEPYERGMYIGKVAPENRSVETWQKRKCVSCNRQQETML